MNRFSRGQNVTQGWFNVEICDRKKNCWKKVIQKEMNKVKEHER